MYKIECGCVVSADYLLVRCPTVNSHPPDKTQISDIIKSKLMILSQLGTKIIFVCIFSIVWFLISVSNYLFTTLLQTGNKILKCRDMLSLASRVTTSNV